VVPDLVCPYRSSKVVFSRTEFKNVYVNAGCWRKSGGLLEESGGLLEESDGLLDEG
jgi:hypothetical protein